MRTLAAAFLSLTLAAVPAWSAEDKPGTPIPHSPAWGADHMDQLREAFKAVLHASRYPLKDKTELVFFPQALKDAKGKALKNADGSPRLGPIPALFVGAGAMAFAPDLGLNKGNPKAVVAATVELFTMCHDNDELGFVLSHELAHLELGHHKKLFDNMEKVFAAWYPSLPGSFTDKASPAQLREEFRKAKAGELAGFQRSLEDEADARGLELMKQAGFQERAASRAMLHIQDMAWALDWGHDAAHPTELERAKGLREKVEGMSLPPDWNRAQP